VRPAAKEQVESLGGKFVAVEDDEFKQAETAGGYAKEMSKEYQAKQAELVANHIAKQDIVITTALIPGRPAPKLVTKQMIAAMAPGSVLVDLAVERGGNVEGAVSNKVSHVGDVSIIGYENMAGRIGATASQLYAKNLFAFLETMIDKESSSLKVDWDDELVTATLLTRDGAVVHPAFVENTDATTPAKKTAGKAPGKAKAKAKPKVAAKPKASSENTSDDLTRIDGIGPANAKKLNAAGVTGFAQIAGWSSKEQHEFGERLAFAGRIEREEWVKQAKQLISDGEG